MGSLGDETDLLESMTNEQEEDDPQETSPGLDEVCQIFYPCLKTQDELTKAELRSRLEDLGAVTLSHIKVLKEVDLVDLVKVADFRLCLEKAQQQLKNSESSNPATRSPSIYVVDLKALLSPTFYSKLMKDEDLLSKQERLKLIVAIADDIRENSKYTRRTVRSEALKVVKAYPTSMGCLMKDDADIQEATEILTNSLMGHIQYINSEARKTGTTVSEKKLKRFSKAENYGLDSNRDLPNDLPDGETPETQESKRALMVTAYNSGDPPNWPSIKKMMDETYCGQRHDVHERLSMEAFLKRWPFIGKHSILQAHFERLMNFSVAQRMEDGASKLFPNLEKFFEAETNKTRKGKAASIPTQLHKTLKGFKQGEFSASRHLITIVLCSMVYMGVKESELFVRFEETTSYDEVQASSLLPADGKPIIAVLGNPIMNPKAYVVAEKRCISEDQVSCAKAISILMMVYFVFKFSYGPRAAPVLHFLQRKFFGIDCEGTKTQRKQGKNGKYLSVAPNMPAPYLTLMKDFKAFCHKWSYEY